MGVAAGHSMGWAANHLSPQALNERLAVQLVGPGPQLSPQPRPPWICWPDGRRRGSGPARPRWRPRKHGKSRHTLVPHCVLLDVDSLQDLHGRLLDEPTGAHHALLCRARMGKFMHVEARPRAAAVADVLDSQLVLRRT